MNANHDAIARHLDEIGFLYSIQTVEAEPAEVGDDGDNGGEGGYGLLLMTMAGVNAAMTLRVTTSPDLVRLVVYHGPFIPAESRPRLYELVARRNWDLLFGAFSVDPRDGELVFSAGIPASEPPTGEEISRMIRSAFRALDWFTLAVQGVLAGEDPAHALAEADRKEAIHDLIQETGLVEGDEDGPFDDSQLGLFDSDDRRPSDEPTPSPFPDLEDGD